MSEAAGVAIWPSADGQMKIENHEKERNTQKAMGKFNLN